ncbi:hypothetical protein D0Z08_04225 [Nocardioides immobilis]|uniref:DUF2029 domain-containing protein n=1 Tax=Nocardioides immobilis TaxID=2049295 RepID=A0A417Y6A9_9ACTN|nr:hypothetical protein D0Z08_04225 [Nocardioides immobilis]
MTRGVAGSFLVLIGGLGVSTLPPSSPLLQSGMLDAIRGAQAGRMSALFLVLAGLGLLASAWLALCRHVAQAVGEDRRDALDLVRFAAMVWSAPLVLAPPLFSRDGWSYAAQGMLARVGLSPYEHGPSSLLGRHTSTLFDQYQLQSGEPIVQAVDPMWADTPTPYGPLHVWLGEVGAGLTGNPWVLVVGHRVIALAGLVLLAWAVPRLAQWTGVNPALASALVLLSPLMMANGVGGLHNDLLMVGLMAAALVVGVERHWAWGTAIGALAAAVKVPGGLVCIGIALATVPAGAALAVRLKRLAAVAATAVAVLLGLGVVTGLGHGWIGALTVPGTITTPLSITSLAGGVLDWVALQLGLGLPQATFRDFVRGLGLVGIVGVAAGVALRWRTGDRAAAVGAVATVTAAFVVLCPVVHLWYFLVLPPFFATLQLGRTALSALIAVSVILGMVAPLDSSLHGAYYAIVLGCMTLGVLLPVILLTRGAREQIDRIASSRWPVLQ